MCKKSAAYFLAEKRSFCLQRSVFFTTIVKITWPYKIQSTQYLPVSVEVGRENTEKYARLIHTLFANVFEWEFLYAAFFTLRCKQTFIGHISEK